MKKNSITIAAIFSVICVLSTAASAIPSISVDGEQTTDIGSTNKFNIILNEAPNGLSGYKMTVSLANASLGEITSIDFPGWASVNSKGSLPSDSVLIKAVDIRDLIKAGANNIILATVNIRRDDLGNISLNIIEQLDDDNGNPIIKNTDPNNVQNQSSSIVPGSTSTTYVDESIIKSVQDSANKSISDGQTSVSNSNEGSENISTNDSISSTSVLTNTSSSETGTKSQQEISGFQIILALLGLVAASIYRRI